MHVWITKYSLTQGIIESEAEQCLDTCPSGSMILRKTPGNYNEFYHRPDWQQTREAAVARAEVMRKKKLASLRKQISKLEALSFDD